jgi:TolB-like protein/tetratricopeptide (TPR) repeat protein
MQRAATIAVLPFESLSRHPEEAYLARGFVDELVTELGRFASLDVIHPRSSARLTGDATAATLGASHVLGGSVRRERDTVRVTVRLEEAQSGRQLWADRLDAPLGELPSIEAEIVARVAVALALKIDETRLGRARRQPITSLEAYDCWLRGIDLLRGGTRDDDERARRAFTRALELDPHFARAHAGVSLSHFNEWSCQAWERWDETERLAFEAARRAADLDDGDHAIQLVLGRILLFRREFDAAARHVDLALALNPSDADALVQASLCKTMLGEPEAAVELIERAIRLHPLHDDWYFGVEAFPHFVLGDYARAIETGSRAWGTTVDLPAYGAAAHAYLGQRDEAARHLAAFLEEFVERITFGRTPDAGEPLRWVLHVNPFRRPEDAEHLAEGLRRAGLPDDPDLARPAVARPDTSAEAVFRHEGELWMLAYRGRCVRLSDVKGLHDLACLLAHPGERFHCLELAGRPPDLGLAGPVLDRTARTQVQGRIRELQAELDEAEAQNDLGRSARARAELDALVSELGRALGIGARARSLGSPSERARSAVTWRIRSAIRKVASTHRELGRHLENAVKTGTYCTYAPEAPVGWELGPLTM